MRVKALGAPLKTRLALSTPGFRRTFETSVETLIRARSSLVGTLGLAEPTSTQYNRNMDVEIGYNIRNLHPIQAKTPDLQSLRLWGSHLKGQWCRTFEGRHDNQLSLLDVEVQLGALSTLTQYYDPPLKCFTFRDFQLAPTLKEYERLLGLHMAKSPPYLFRGYYPSWASVAKLLKMSELEVLRRKRNRNGLEGL
ncbi:hypothetical protein CR513_48737, partial [Mucuna pruriens]